MKVRHFYIALIVFFVCMIPSCPTGMDSKVAQSFLTLSGISMLVMVYFAPSSYAYKIGHPDRSMVLLINLLFGWTIIGWVASIVIGCNGKGQQNITMAPIPLPSSASLTDQLSELETLKGRGLINDEEYKAQRLKILS